MLNAVRCNSSSVVDAGKSCKKASQCCSNICQGKQGKKKCRAHNVLGCKAGEDFCTGNIVQCGTNGRCHRTTGKASYCAKFNDCIQCSKDIECEDTHGVGAACVVCPLCVESNDTTTQCVSAAV